MNCFSEVSNSDFKLWIEASILNCVCQSVCQKNFLGLIEQYHGKIMPCKIFFAPKSSNNIPQKFDVKQLHLLKDRKQLTVLCNSTREKLTLANFCEGMKKKS